eukprot:Colp12_sorted_trinity150504_noHs@14948
MAFKGPVPAKFCVGAGVYLDHNIVTFDSYTLEDGTELLECPVAYRTWGTLNSDRDNVIVVCHALTGHADVSTWWGDLVGEGKTIDTNKYFAICMNVLGSPYGTASPVTINPKTGKKYGADFPIVTIRDTVRLHRRVLDEIIKIKSVFAAIGASLGGMQVLEWSFFGPQYVRHLIPIATCAKHSAWCIGFDETQREAIYNDPKWRGGYYPEDDPPTEGIGLARMVAMLTYRSQPSLERKFGRREQDPATLPARYQTHREGEPYFFTIQSYLRYQGRKLAERFDANCYVRLTQMMDLHDISRGRYATLGEALGSISQSTLLVGITSDILYPVEEQEELKQHLRNVELVVFHAADGHDGLFVECEQLDRHISSWLSRQT